MSNPEIPDSLPEGFGDQPKQYGPEIHAAILRAAAATGQTLTQIANSKVDQSICHSRFFHLEIGAKLQAVVVWVSLLGFLAWVLR